MLGRRASELVRPEFPESEKRSLCQWRTKDARQGETVPDLTAKFCYTVPSITDC